MACCAAPAAAASPGAMPLIRICGAAMSGVAALAPFSGAAAGGAVVSCASTVPLKASANAPARQAIRTTFPLQSLIVAA